MPPLLTFGSWMGGDRDGNPNVTAAVTAEALEMMRTACLHLLEARIEVLAQRVSLSRAARGRSATSSAARWPRSPSCSRRRPRGRLARNPEEPYRRYFSLRGRARARDARGRRAAATARRPSCSPTCGSRSGCCASGQRQFVAATQLHDTIRQVEVFGFHFARLDVREHAARHGDALGRGAVGARRARGVRVAGAGRARARCSRARSPSGGR